MELIGILTAITIWDICDILWTPHLIVELLLLQGYSKVAEVSLLMEKGPFLLVLELIDFEDNDANVVCIISTKHFFKLVFDDFLCLQGSVCLERVLFMSWAHRY